MKAEKNTKNKRSDAEEYLRHILMNNMFVETEYGSLLFGNKATVRVRAETKIITETTEENNQSIKRQKKVVTVSCLFSKGDEHLDGHNYMTATLTTKEDVDEIMHHIHVFTEKVLRDDPKMHMEWRANKVKKIVGKT